MSEQIAKQRQLQRMIERALDNFKKIGKNNLTPAKIRSRITSLKETWRQMLDGHAVLAKAVPEATKSSLEYFKDEVIDATEELYQLSLDYMAECLEELEPVVSHDDALNSSRIRPGASAVSISNLPSIRMPPFDGNYNEWESFRDRFTTLIIHNKELNDFARMHFLTASLKGRAFDCIANITVTADNFDIAWKTLTSRYESKRRLINRHLSSLLNLTALSRESASELQTLSDNVNIAVSSLNKLQRSPSDLWNDVLTHVVTSKLDPVTRKAWNVKISDCDEPPLFDDLLRFINSSTRAIEESTPTTLNKPIAKTSTTHQAHVTTGSTSSPSLCPLCKARHYFSVCPTFIRAIPSQRRALARQHRRCFNCLSQNHSAQECKSKYSCRLCHKQHHTMLHTSFTDLHADSDLRVSSPQNSQSSIAPPPACQSSTKVEPISQIHSLLTSTNSRQRSKVLLATAWVTVGVVPAGLSWSARFSIKVPRLPSFPRS